MPEALKQNRIDWVDCAKGLSILLVVMMHSTLGVQKSLETTGILDHIITFASTLRMPVFFIVAGLFCASALAQSWQSFLDKKILHFVYFYILWSLLQIGLKLAIGGGNHAAGWLDILLLPIEPFGTIWFIYILPWFFLITRLLRAVSLPLLFAFACVLHLAWPETGWTAVDAGAKWYLFFLIGTYGAARLFETAELARSHFPSAMVWILAFAVLNFTAMVCGVQHIPGLFLILSLMGALAVISLCAHLPGTWIGQILTFCGKHSLYIYLAFFVPMAASRIIILKTPLANHVDLAALTVTVVSVLGALAIYYLCRQTPLSFLFKRPKSLHSKFLNSFSAHKA